MKRLLIITSVTLLLAVGTVLSFAPDTLSMLIVGLMILAVGGGYFFGILPAISYMHGFEVGLENLEKAKKTSASSIWSVVDGYDRLFQQKNLDKLFLEYRAKVRQQEAEKKLVSDIVEFINEDVLALLSWQSVVQQIPGTLTALGLLGTFLGLILGINGVGFSSVDAALSSIEILLSGIRIAFYTSIVGVILSTLFNLMYRLIWNAMLRQLGMFIEEFHRKVLPSMDDQLRDHNVQDAKMILERLERLQQNQTISADFSENSPGAMRLMPEIQEGLQNGEFIFYVQPRFDLNSKRIVAGEALIRWNHGEMGIITASGFVPMLEKNGFIVRLDQHIWESVCKTIRRWIDEGYRPVPIAVNVSKTDLLAIDLPDCLEKLIREYRIPPRYVEIEIAANAYFENEKAARDAETRLRQLGFHIAVDGIHVDFSEMHALQGTQADSVKLDLRTLPHEEDTARVIRNAFDKITLMNIPVAVVGIENAAQLSALRSCGCAEGQGYYLSKEVPLDAFEEMIGYTE